MDINSLSATERQKVLYKKVGRFYSSCNVPFKAVEHETFIDLVDTLIEIDPKTGKNLKFLTRQTLSKTVMRQVLNDLEVIKKKLLQNTISIIMTDGWKNKSNNKKYLVFTLKNINVDCVFLTAYDYSTEKEDTESLAAKITEAIKVAKEKYETYVKGIITGNDKKIKAGAREATDDNGKKLLQRTCYSHSGKLLVKTLIEESFSGQVKNVVNTFSNPKMTLLLRSCGGTRLFDYPDTRFGFFRSTCESILKNLKALYKVCELPNANVPLDVEKLILSTEFKSKLLETMRTLTPICILINYCQATSTNIADGTEY